MELEWNFQTAEDNGGTIIAEAWGRVEQGTSYPLLRLVALREMRRWLNSMERAIVRDARDKYASWGDIGNALGISKQAAAKRFADVGGQSQRW